MTAPDVTQYGAGTNGERSCGFSASPGIAVLVKPMTKHDNAEAMRTARRLAGQAAQADEDAARLRKLETEANVMAATIARLERELIAVRAKIPPKQPARLLGPARARFDERGRLWLLDPAKGWAGMGFMLDGWDDLFRNYAVRITHHGADAEGPFWAVENNPTERTP